MYILYSPNMLIFTHFGTNIKKNSCVILSRHTVIKDIISFCTITLKGQCHEIFDFWIFS
jgi:hypothetical protein